MHYEFQVDSEDEIGYLASCLNYMASEIARSEDDQKKFVANVSHDFRSPLTSIRGISGGHAGRHNSTGNARKIHYYRIE